MEPSGALTVSDDDSTIKGPNVGASTQHPGGASPATEKSATEKSATPITPAAPELSPPTLAPAAVVERPVEPKPTGRGTVVFVIDDAGNNLTQLTPFLSFPGPLCIAVMPGLPYSAEAARRVRAAGKELILHQPMEPMGGQNPGPGAIYADMSSDEVLRILEQNVAEIGPVAGINNHEGSKVTSSERVMGLVLAFCRDHGVYYLDSRTTAATVVPSVATRTGIRIRERDVFIDNIQERAAMIRSIHEGMQKAEKKGGAIMIGHVWSSDLAALLQELYPELVEQGYSLSTISQIMMGEWDDEDSGN